MRMNGSPEQSGGTQAQVEGFKEAPPFGRRASLLGATQATGFAENDGFNNEVVNSSHPIDISGFWCQFRRICSLAQEDRINWSNVNTHPQLPGYDYLSTPLEMFQGCVTPIESPITAQVCP